MNYNLSFGMYPSLLRKTTPIYFLEWPEETLRHVATKCIAELSISKEPEVKFIENWGSSRKRLKISLSDGTPAFKPSATTIIRLQKVECM